MCWKITVLFLALLQTFVFLCTKNAIKYCTAYTQLWWRRNNFIVSRAELFSYLDCSRHQRRSSFSINCIICTLSKKLGGWISVWQSDEKPRARLDILVSICKMNSYSFSVAHTVRCYFFAQLYNTLPCTSPYRQGTDFFVTLFFWISKISFDMKKYRSICNNWKGGVLPQ